MIKYAIDHWNKLRRPTHRVVTPILTIGLVILAFAFIPSLFGAKAAKIDGRSSSHVGGR